jgi:hypothetical protein
MRFMAFYALRNHGMPFGMAEITRHFTVHAWILCKFLPHRFMAAQADLLEFPFQADVQGSMRVMATLAILESKMGCPGMTVAAGWNVVRYLGAVPQVA